MAKNKVSKSENDRANYMALTRLGSIVIKMNKAITRTGRGDESELTQLLN